MHRHPFHPTVEFVAVVTVLTAWAVPCAAQTEIDVFMERVLDRREENWITLRQYVLDEREVFEVRGPDRVPLQSMHREYMWYVRDGPLCLTAVWDQPGERCITVSFNCEFVAAGRRGDTVESRGEVIRRTGSFTFARGQVLVGDRTLLNYSGIVKRLRPPS